MPSQSGLPCGEVPVTRIGPNSDVKRSVEEQPASREWKCVVLVCQGQQILCIEQHCWPVLLQCSAEKVERGRWGLTLARGKEP
jgi:hypothetical protein